MTTLILDIKYGLRQLRKNPGFTAVAVLTLALGIGANTAIFSVVYGVLLRPLPYPQAERIVQISLTYRGELASYSGFTATAFDFWRQQSKPFQYVAAFTHEGFTLAGAGRPEHIDALRVSLQYFDVYGVQPLFGRSFSPDEDSLGGPNVAILSNRLWQEHFNGDPKAIGRNVLLNGTPYTVIGVMPAGFASIPPAQLWTTIGQVRRGTGSGQNFDVIARLKPGVTGKQATSYLASVTGPFVSQNYQWMSEQDRKLVGFAAPPYRYMISSDYRTPLLVLFGAIGFVLLIACGNVANLLMARAATRGREMAIRTALGARRRRIFRQLLTESILMSLLGGALGLVVAHWGLNALVAIAPRDLPRARQIGLDRWALAFTAAISLLTGILFGLAPAFQLSRTSLSESLKEGAGRATTGRGHRRLGAALVSGEVALSLVLLIGSALLIETFANLLSVNPGFDPSHVLSMQIWTTGSHYKTMPELANFYSALVQKFDAIPGVSGAGLIAAGLPLERGGNVNPGVKVNGKIEHPSVDYREITPGFFRALGVPLLAGRLFTEADSAISAKVTIINAAFARRYFRGQNPVGHHLILGTPAEIVGMVGDVRSSLNEAAPPTFFIPFTQADFANDQGFQGWFPTSILVRTGQNPLSLSHTIVSAVESAAPDIPIGQVSSMNQVLAVSLAFQRLLMMLMTLFAGLALVLAAVGIYGVMAYGVAQRTHEIGIRMALGAQRNDVLRLIVRQGLILALAGVGIGLIGAFALTRLLSGVLFGVKATDPGTFSVVALILIVVAILASYIPARRATQVDPMVALRYE